MADGRTLSIRVVQPIHGLFILNRKSMFAGDANWGGSREFHLVVFSVFFWCWGLA